MELAKKRRVEGSRSGGGEGQWRAELYLTLLKHEAQSCDMLCHICLYHHLWEGQFEGERTETEGSRVTFKGEA